MHRATWPLVLTVSVICLLVMPSVATHSVAALLTVCGSGCDHATIQDAVVAAAPGDTLDLAAETFVENVYVTKDLIIRGSGTGSTFVDANSWYSGFSVSGATVTIEKMTIQNAYGQSGGGIACYGSDTVLTVNDCEIIDNESEYGGAGIFNASGTVTITSTTISGNHSYFRGGGLANSGGRMMVHDSLLIDNVAYDDGGGVAITAGEVIITDTVVLSNSARYGGGVWATGVPAGETNLTIQRSSIIGNGAMYFTGGLMAYGLDGVDETVLVSDSLIADNTAWKQAGAFVGHGAVRNSTIANNRSSEDEPGGLKSYEATVQQTIVAGNTPTDCSTTGIISAGYNLSGDSSCGFAEPSDIPATDPLFVDVSKRNYHLRPGSPALEHGPDPATYLGDPCCDRDGAPRLQDYDGDGLARIDIGAYEHGYAGPAPGEVAELLWIDRETMIWAALPSAAHYNVYRGDLLGLGYAGFGGCWLQGLGSTMASDADPLPSGAARFYLVTAADGVADEGTLGSGSCAERSNFDACE